MADIIKIYSNDLAGKKESFYDREKASINQTFFQLKNVYERSMNRFWTDDLINNVTVQQKFDAFGTQAAQLFQISDAMAQMLVAIMPTYTPPSPSTFGYSYAFNPDMSVTVTKAQ